MTPKKKRQPGRLVARLGIAAIALGATVGIAACGSSGSSLSLVAYSTPQQVYEQSLEPGFKKTSDGKDVDFSNSFGASGDQSRAVESGQPADVVMFSLEPDMQRLVDAGIVSADWNQNQYKGIVTNSVVTLMVRPGNPKHITSFDDLAKPDVDVIDPNPATSGGARWNIMAIYGSQIAEGKSPAQARPSSSRSWRIRPFRTRALVIRSTRSRAARATCWSARERRHPGGRTGSTRYVTPANTILIENPIAVTKDAPSEAQKFVNFLYTDQGQQDFADAGYRPVVKSVFDKNASKFPTPSGLFTIDKFGGWAKVSDPFFGDNGWVIQAEKDLGNPTS